MSLAAITCAGFVSGPHGKRRDSIGAMSEEHSDEALIAAFLEARDERAFAELFDRHKNPLYRYLLHLAYAREDAAEITQLAWLKVLDGFAKGAYSAREGASFKSWLYAVANNCRIDFYRSRNLRLVKDDHVSLDEESESSAPIAIASGADPADSLEREQFRAAYFKALGELPENQRRAYLLKEDGDLSVDEIAATMKVNFETAKSYLRYAREKLREKLRDWHEA